MSPRQLPRSPAAPRVCARTSTDTIDVDEVEAAGEFANVRVSECEIGAVGEIALDWRDLQLTGVTASGADLGDVTMRDVIFDDALLANALCSRNGLWERVAVHSSQCTGARWWDALMRDVSFARSNLRLASFRHSQLRTLTLNECDLREVDFSGATLTDVMFSGCDLRGADFTGVTCSRVNFEACDLDDARGLTGLRGASITLERVIAMAPMLAATLGIDVVMPGDEEH